MLLALRTRTPCLVNNRPALAATLKLHNRIRSRNLLTLAIETSCDDTSVAVLEKRDEITLDEQPRAILHFHEKVTSDNRTFQGVNPIHALESHQENLAFLISKATKSFPARNGRSCRPDFISVTRGPGMRSSVNTGLDTAKGLAVAYGVPLVGVNHMQAHALTPRLVSALHGTDPTGVDFPFLSLLVSGGHTMLLHSRDLISHEILASTTDVAIGDALDKIAREVLPTNVVASAKDVSYARDLESFVFPGGAAHEYSPSSRAQEVARNQSRWGWSLPIPLTETRGGQKTRAMEFSFSGLDSTVRRIVAARCAHMDSEERAHLGYEAMRIAFEHVASRTVFALDDLKLRASEPSSGQAAIRTLVASGGVAANGFMRTIFRRYLDAKGYSEIALQFPPLEFCTDNAAMIAWAGMEMFEAGWESSLAVRSLRKWTLDPSADDGGILGVGGWNRRQLPLAG